MTRYRKAIVAVGGAVVAWGLFFGVDLNAPVAATIHALSSVLVYVVPND